MKRRDRAICALEGALETCQRVIGLASLLGLNGAFFRAIGTDLIQVQKGYQGQDSEESREYCASFYGICPHNYSAPTLAAHGFILYISTELALMPRNS